MVAAGYGHIVCACSDNQFWSGAALAFDRELTAHVLLGGTPDLQWFVDDWDEGHAEGALVEALFTPGFDLFARDLPGIHLVVEARLGVAALVPEQGSVDRGVAPVLGASVALELGTTRRPRLLVSDDDLYVVTGGVGLVWRTR